MEFVVLLYYKYATVENVEIFRQQQEKICKQLNLKGRIIVASEGINGTLEGWSENIQKYCDDLIKKPGFEDINFKKSQSNGQSFPRLSVKIRSEIVSSHLEDIDPNRSSGKYLTSEELHQWFESNKEFFIIDMRNDYEHQGGFFENSILPKLANFRDLPQILSDIEHLKNKTIVTVCTGGVRCEKASAFLLKHGFVDIYQLKDGIVTYMEKYPNQHFKGRLYVFDQRMLMGFNTDSPEHEIVGRCQKCNKISENYINIKENGQRKHLICCQECINKGLVELD